jgi:hypothetical protein
MRFSRALFSGKRSLRALSKTRSRACSLPGKLADSPDHLHRCARPMRTLANGDSLRPMSEEAKKRLKDLAKQVRDKVTTTGQALLHQKGLELVEEMAKELASPDGMPGLLVLRDGVHKLRLQRPHRNAEIAIEWHRDIGALSMTSEKHGEPKRMVRYVFDEAQTKWRRLEGGGDVWDDVTTTIVEFLYPEAK